MTACPYCQSGRIAVEPGSSQTYRCPDCQGIPTFDPGDCDDRDHIETEEEETKGPQ